MRCYTSCPKPWNISTKQNFFINNGQVLADPAYLSRLEHQKELLETNLANCVTYLQALRKKHARGARQLDSDAYLPRKKKKKIQQNMRQLEKEIQYRERDEKAFLNNLQACKTNIYLAETVSSPSASGSSTIPDFASDSTLSPCSDESEPTESSWCSWADTTARCPIQRNFMTAPAGECSDSGSECVEQTNAARSLPMTSVPTQFMFRPEAAVFKPQVVEKDQDA